LNNDNVQHIGKHIFDRNQNLRVAPKTEKSLLNIFWVILCKHPYENTTVFDVKSAQINEN